MDEQPRREVDLQAKHGDPVRSGAPWSGPSGWTARRRNNLIAAAVGAIVGILSAGAIVLFFPHHEADQVYPILGDNPESACSTQDVGAQCSWIVGLEKDQSALIQGYLVYPNNLDVDVSGTVELDVKVYGSSIFQDLIKRGDVSGISGASRSHVFIGGNVRAQASSDTPASVSVVRQSSEDQPMVGPDAFGEWIWQLRPSRAGSSHISITFNVLRGNSDNLLTPDRDFTITLNSHQTAAHAIQSVWQSILGFIQNLAVICTALGITAVGIGAWAFKRVKKVRPKVEGESVTEDEA